jgi:hypothetical protein
MDNRWRESITLPALLSEQNLMRCGPDDLAFTPQIDKRDYAAFPFQVREDLTIPAELSI